MEIWSFGVGKYHAMYANSNRTYELARIIASMADLIEFHCYLSIGEGVHVRPPVDIHVTPGRIVLGPRSTAAPPTRGLWPAPRSQGSAGTYGVTCPDCSSGST